MGNDPTDIRFTPDPNVISTPRRGSPIREKGGFPAILARSTRLAARVAFSLTLFTLPWRFRFLIAAHPIPPIYGDYTDYLLFASDIFLAATLMFWLLSLGFNPRRVESGPLVLSVPLFGLMATGFISTISSVDPAVSLYNAFRLLAMAGFYLYVVNEIYTVGWILVPIGAQVLLQALVGIAQNIEQHSLGLAWLGELVLDPEWRGVSVVGFGEVRSLRAYGLTDHPNLLGGSLALALLLLIAWQPRNRPRWYPVVTTIVIAGGLALFLTFSRSAWIALAVGLGMFLFWLYKQGYRAELIGVLSLLVALGILITPFLLPNARFLGVRFNVEDAFSQVTLERYSVNERQELNAAANQLFVANPIRGVGLGAFPIALLAEKPDFHFNYQPPHNVLLAAASETGIFGALFYFLAVVGPWLGMWFNRERIVITPALIASSCLLAMITVIGLVDYYPWLLAPGRLWLWLSWGLWSSQILKAQDNT